MTDTERHEPLLRWSISMIVVAWLTVAAISLVSGGFAIPIGFALGLSAIEVYLAATAGSLVGLFVFLFAGDKVRSRLTQNRPEKDLDQTSRVGELADKYGAKGLGLVGPLFPGVTASVLLGLTLGMDKASLARWMSIGICVMFALYCGGLWLLIEVVGVE
jgi:hypothetical protein